MNSHLSADRRRSTLVMAAVAALAMLAWLAVGQTRAYFAGTTSNTGNTLGTTSVSLDNNKATALFNLSGMLPGSTDTQTIQISNPSAASMGLRLYGADFFVDDDGVDPDRGASDIADYLDLLVTIDGTPEQVVFQGTLAEFAGALEYADGHWTCSATPADCSDEPDPEPEWVGLLESTLRAALPATIEEDPTLEDFWIAVKAVDTATRTQQEAIPTEEPTVPPTPEPTVPPTPEPTPPATPGPDELMAQVQAAYETIPEAVRDGIPGPIRDEVEAIIYGTGPGTMSAQSASVGPDGDTPTDRGDRIAAFPDADSIRTYTFTVTMRADAGTAANLGPNHRASITFVWEGRA